MLGLTLLLALFVAPIQAGAQDAELDQAHEIAALIPVAIQEGDLEGAREILSEAVGALEEPEAGEENEHVDFLRELAKFAVELGSLQQELGLREDILALRSRLLPADHEDVLDAMHNLAVVRDQLDDFAGAHELEEAVLAARMRLLTPDHPDLISTQAYLAILRTLVGDLHGAQELHQLVLEARTRLLPPDHEDLLEAQHNLAVIKKELGDLRGARELEEAVLAARLRLFPPDHPDLLRVQKNLASTRRALGDLQGARELEAVVLEVETRRSSPELTSMKYDFAMDRMIHGDLQGAHELFEAVLEAQTRSLSPDDSRLLETKFNLAQVRNELGDTQGAHELFEAVLEARSRLLAPNHFDLLMAKRGLAMTRKKLGDFAGARELEESAIEAMTRLVSPDDQGLRALKADLAVTRSLLGDLQGAKVLFEEVLESTVRRLPPDHPEILKAKHNLAMILKYVGDVQGARELEEAVLAARARVFSPDHPDLLRGKMNLAQTCRTLGDLAGARELVASLLAGMRVRAGALSREAPRPAREGARVELTRLSRALSLSTAVDPEGALAPALFATLEELRLASVASGELTQVLFERPELVQEADAVADVRTRLSDLVAAEPDDEEGAKAWRAQLLVLTEERDRAERSLRRGLAEAGAFVGEIESKAVGARLGSGVAAVSFLRYERDLEPDAQSGEAPPSADSVLAFVVSQEGHVQRVELGIAAELETLVQDWRASLGKPLERGIAAEADGESAEVELGRALRMRVLDPVLAAAGEGVNTLHVVLDDLLFLVPLDALPLEGEARVGERFKIHVEPTLGRLLRAERPVAAEGTLVAVGGVDFEAEATAVVEEQKRVDEEPVAKDAGGDGLPLVASAPSIERSGRPQAFEPLRQTRYEVEDVGAQYEEGFANEPVLLMRAEATKARLHALAPKTRYLHLATHGWFAGESFQPAEGSGRAALDRAQESLTVFAPETLCGLALSGANRGTDARGHVAGILTAEELATFDLRNCELAVLSACETNVGIRRAGQGIQSLQTALHAAGARTAITSLWKVDDAATRRLFELFYTKLWQEKLGTHEALWQAKSALRAEGHPPRDWAGWVLSGDPH